LPYYDSPEQLDLLNTLYARLHLCVNFFLPVMKLEEKVRIGSRVERVYDDPRTLHARLLANHLVSDEAKSNCERHTAIWTCLTFGNVSTNYKGSWCIPNHPHNELAMP
jgi:hypothetical protein